MAEGINQLFTSRRHHGVLIICVDSRPALSEKSNRNGARRSERLRAYTVTPASRKIACNIVRLADELLGREELPPTDIVP